MSELVVAVLPSVVAIVAFASWWVSEEQRIRRALQRAPRVDIHEARAGDVVKIIGKVASAGAQLQAPLSGRACVLYDVLVLQRYGNNGWREIIRETNAVDFLVEDETGRAIVQTRPIRLHAENDRWFDSGFMNDATPQLEAFLEKHGKESGGLMFNKTLRYQECVFEAGELVAALGEAGWERDPDPDHAGEGYRDAPKRLVIAPHEGAVILSDEPRVTAA